MASSDRHRMFKSLFQCSNASYTFPIRKQMKANCNSAAHIQQKKAKQNTHQTESTPKVRARSQTVNAGINLCARLLHLHSALPEILLTAISTPNTDHFLTRCSSAGEKAEQKWASPPVNVTVISGASQSEDTATSGLPVASVFSAGRSNTKPDIAVTPQAPTPPAPSFPEPHRRANATTLERNGCGSTGRGAQYVNR